MKWFKAVLLAGAITAWPWPVQAHPDFNNAFFYCRGQDYQGKVMVKKDGEDTFAVLWRIGQVSYAGTGFYEHDRFFVAYVDQSGKHIGLAVYRKEGHQWIGRWTQLGAKRTLKEIWQADTMPEAFSDDLQSRVLPSPRMQR